MTVDGSESKILRKGSVREEGVEILRYRVELPVDREEELNGLHRQIVQRLEKFCKETLADVARRAFAESDDPQKRFRFPTFFYLLQGTIDRAKPSRADITLEIKLSRRDGHEPLCVEKKRYRWYL